MDGTTNHSRTTSLAEAAAGHWALDPGRSSIAIQTTGWWGLAKIRGVFNTFSAVGEVLADGSAHGTLTIDATSVDTRVAKRDEHLRGADFFHVADHPSIDFAATRVAPTGRATAQVTGELSVLGRTRPVSFTAQVTEASADAVTLTAELGIARKDFGMTWNRLGIMKDITTVTITARFTRSAP